MYGIVIKDGKILLSPQRNSGYDLPGGGVEISETLEEAVVREVKEETGIDVQVVNFVGMLENFFTWEPGEANTTTCHSICLYYVCEAIGGTLSTDGFDAYEREYAELAEWVDVAFFPSIAVASTLDFKPVVMKVLGEQA